MSSSQVHGVRRLVTPDPILQASLQIPRAPGQCWHHSAQVQVWHLMIRWHLIMSSLSSYNVGERLAVICRPGFVISGQRSSVQCTASGHWSAELPECLAWDWTVKNGGKFISNKYFIVEYRILEYWVERGSTVESKSRKQDFSIPNLLLSCQI